MSKFHLLFYGETNSEFELDEVKKNFKNYFHLTDVQIKYLFSGKEIILKKNLTQAKALQYALRIDELGGISYFQPLVADIFLPPDVYKDRRKKERRTRPERRKHYRAGIISDRRSNHDRRKSNPEQKYA